MLKERLLNKEFYLDHMSMFLKDSFGMIDREETYRAVLNNVDGIANSIMSRYDLFNKMFTEDYFIRNKIVRDSTEDAMLDNLAETFGISRTLKLSGEVITLTNLELFIYICVTIRKLNFHGTFAELEDLYLNSNTYIKDLKITYCTSAPLICDVYLGGAVSENIEKLFLADKLLLESLGITYTKHIGTNTVPAQFDVHSDIANFKYVFDPDFNEESQPGFKYAVFS